MSWQPPPITHVGWFWCCPIKGAIEPELCITWRWWWAMPLWYVALLCHGVANFLAQLAGSPPGFVVNVRPVRTAPEH